jgi:hypothetical protein
MRGFGALISEKASIPEVRGKLKSIREFLAALVVSVQKGRPAGAQVLKSALMLPII